LYWFSPATQAVNSSWIITRPFLFSWNSTASFSVVTLPT
jgi:hypothetical protein